MEEICFGKFRALQKEFMDPDWTPQTAENQRTREAKGSAPDTAHEEPGVLRNHIFHARYFRWWIWEHRFSEKADTVSSFSPPEARSAFWQSLH